MINLYLRKDGEDIFLTECENISKGISKSSKLYRFLGRHYDIDRLVFILREDNKENDVVYVVGGIDHDRERNNN